jgi:hypothetical protein
LIDKEFAMTARQIYEQGISALPARERLSLARLILDDLRESPTAQDELGEAWAEEIRRATIPNELLLAWARKQGPPQSWWDETDDPFAPERSQ